MNEALRHWLGVAAATLLFSWVIYTASTWGAPPAEFDAKLIGRYQIHSCADGSHYIFRVDTVTGRVWRSGREGFAGWGKWVEIKD